MRAYTNVCKLKIPNDDQNSFSQFQEAKAHSHLPVKKIRFKLNSASLKSQFHMSNSDMKGQGHELVTMRVRRQYPCSIMLK